MQRGCCPCCRAARDALRRIVLLLVLRHRLLPHLWPPLLLGLLQPGSIRRSRVLQPSARGAASLWQCWLLPLWLLRHQLGGLLRGALRCRLLLWLLQGWRPDHRSLLLLLLVGCWALQHRLLRWASSCRARSGATGPRSLCRLGRCLGHRGRRAAPPHCTA